MEHHPPPKKKITFVYPLAIIERIRQLAAEHGRSLNGEMIWALRQYLARQDRQSSEK
jgi:Arc-like DNA binding dprotein